MSDNAKVSPGKVTAVLITTHKEYPKEVLDHLKQYDFFDEFIIKTESPNVYERYVQASKAKNQIVYVQDDDAIFDVQKIYDAYNGQLTNGMTPHHQAYYEPMGATLVGWGCFFPKMMLLNFRKYVDKYGADFHLFREADRIFTYFSKPFNTIIMAHQDLNQNSRMSHDPMHYEYMRQAIQKCQQIN